MPITSVKFRFERFQLFFTSALLLSFDPTEESVYTLVDSPSMPVAPATYNRH